MINEIINNVASFREDVRLLKEKSSYYPSILEEVRVADVDTIFETSETVLSTLVRVKREGKWYVVHCVERAFINDKTTVRHLYNKFIFSVHQIQNLYKLTGDSRFEELDDNQEEESERLLKQLKQLGI